MSDLPVYIYNREFAAPFALKHSSMLAAGRTDLSRRRFRAAIDSLIKCGLLEIAANHAKGRHGRYYRLRQALIESKKVKCFSAK